MPYFIFKFIFPHERIAQEKTIQSFCLFLWPSSAFFIYACSKRENMAQLMRQSKREGVVPEADESSSLQDSSCLTTASILPKASPLDSRRAFGATLLTLSKRQERQMEKRKAASRLQRRRTLRLTAEEEDRLTRQAATAGISVSEYMRRQFFGGRPIIAKTDDQTIRELRRLGGLLKHHFEVVKRAGNPATLSELDAALREIRRAIEALSERR